MGDGGPMLLGNCLELMEKLLEGLPGSPGLDDGQVLQTNWTDTNQYSQLSWMLLLAL